MIARFWFEFVPSKEEFSIKNAADHGNFADY